MGLSRSKNYELRLQLGQELPDVVDVAGKSPVVTTAILRPHKQAVVGIGVAACQIVALGQFSQSEKNRYLGLAFQNVSQDDFHFRRRYHH